MKKNDSNSETIGNKAENLHDIHKEMLDELPNRKAESMALEEAEKRREEHKATSTEKKKDPIGKKLSNTVSNIVKNISNSPAYVVDKLTDLVAYSADTLTAAPAYALKGAAGIVAAVYSGKANQAEKKGDKLDAKATKLCEKAGELDSKAGFVEKITGVLDKLAVGTSSLAAEAGKWAKKAGFKGNLVGAVEEAANKTVKVIGQDERVEARHDKASNIRAEASIVRHEARELHEVAAEVTDKKEHAEQLQSTLRKNRSIRSATDDLAQVIQDFRVGDSKSTVQNTTPEGMKVIKNAEKIVKEVKESAMDVQGIIDKIKDVTSLTAKDYAYAGDKSKVSLLDAERKNAESQIIFR